MSCPSCRRRVSRLSTYTSSPSPVVALDDVVIENMSAPRLDINGWVSTCVKCGSVSKPQPFSSSITPSCECHLS